MSRVLSPLKKHGRPQPLWLWRAAIAASATAALAIPVLHFLAVFPLVQNIPKWDQWSMIPTWNAYFEGQSVLPHLLQPYNGHYNVLPRVIFFSLGMLSDWNLRWEVVLSYLAALGTLGILLLMLRESGASFLLLAWVVSLQVFSLVQFENYMSGYPFGQVLSQMAATFMVFILTRPELPGKYVGLAALSALVAAFSWGAGVAACLVGCLALVVRGQRHRAVVAAWFTVSVVVLVIVWYGARGGGMGHGALTQGFDALTFALVILGKPLSLMPFPPALSAAVLGALLLGAFALALLGSWVLGQRLLTFRWGLLGLLALLSCLLIGGGRLHAGIEQALASHYATAAYPLILSTVILVTACLFKLRIRSAGAARWLATAALVVILGGVALQPTAVSLRTLRALRSWQNTILPASHRLLDGSLTDDEIRRFFHPNPTLVRRGLVLLRQHKLAMYADSN